MSSKLVYFGNVITRTEALVNGNVIREPKWLKVCKRFPPLSEPVNPALPDWESIEQTRTHRVGNFVRLDGHRYVLLMVIEVRDNLDYRLINCSACEGGEEDMFLISCPS